MKSAFNITLALSAAAILLGCAPAGGSGPAGPDPRVATLEQRVAKLEKALAGKGSKNADGEKGSEQLGTLIAGRVEENLRKTNQAIEQQNFKIEKQQGEFGRLERTVREIRLSLDGVLANPGAAAAPADPAAPSTADQGQASSWDAGAESGKDADRLFHEGMNFYRAQQWQQAADKFAQQRSTYADHASSADALYFLAESHSRLGDYTGAALEFAEFLKNHPDHPNHMDARWKQATSLDQAGQTGIATDLYRNLARYPSAYQERALNRLKELDAAAQ